MAAQPFRRIRETLKETEYFLKAAVRNFQQVGTVFPTSKWIAQTMCKPLFAALNKGANPTVLEIGAGTGSITKLLYKVADKLSRLVVCECNPFYSKYLKAMLNKDFPELINRVEFFEDKIEEFREKSKFDYIISTVPLLCMEREQILSVLRKIQDLSHDDTILTHVEHLGARQLKLALRKDIRDIYRRLQQAQLDSEIVYMNYLPMKVLIIKPSKLDFNGMHCNAS